MLVVLQKWLIWEKKSDKELTVSMLLVTLLLLSEKVSLSGQLHLSLFHFMVVSCTMLLCLMLLFHLKRLIFLQAFLLVLCYLISSLPLLSDPSERLPLVWSNKLEGKSDKTQEFLKELLNLITKLVLESQPELH